MHDNEAKCIEERTGCRGIQSEAAGLIYFVDDGQEALVICGMPIGKKSTKVKLSKSQVAALCWELPEIVEQLGWKRVKGPRLTERDADYCRDLCGYVPSSCERLKSGDRCKVALVYERLQRYEWPKKEK